MKQQPESPHQSNKFVTLQLIMKIREIIGALEDFAPLALQDGFDNAGLQIGLTEDVDATGVLLSLDVTEEVVDEAIARGCNMVVSHHPLLFHPVKSITGNDYIGRIIMKAIKNGIVLYAAHTNLDNAPGGVNHKIAARLGLSGLDWLEPKAGQDGGSGLIGTLASPVSKENFIQQVKQTFGVECVRHNDWHGETIRKVALCGGAGAFLIPKTIEMGADAYVTGEIGYHRFFGHEDDVLMLEIGHYESEQYTTEILHDIITATAPTLPIHTTQLRVNPIHYE